MEKNIIYNYFSDDDFLLISDKIKEMEKLTSGEIRISMRSREIVNKEKPDIRKLAEEEFYRLEMQNTRDKTGILIYLNLHLRQFYILADSGINEKAGQSVWDDVRNEIQAAFVNGQYLKGVLSGIESVGRILSRHFPIKEDDTNEISNQVIL
jgi:uncharacterized membrane protein